MSCEQWRPIRGFEGLYSVSDLGRVKNDRSDRILRGSAAGKGYRKIILCDNGNQTHRYVHEVVLEAFIGPRPMGMDAAHGNGVRSDNRLNNLRWDTRAGNFADKIAHGTSAVGERHGRRKLTAAQVEAIRQSLGTRTAIGKHFGVSQAQVSRIKLGKNWRAA